MNGFKLPNNKCFGNLNPAILLTSHYLLLLAGVKLVPKFGGRGGPG